MKQKGLFKNFVDEEVRIKQWNGANKGFNQEKSVQSNSGKLFFDKI